MLGAERPAMRALRACRHPDVRDVHGLVRAVLLLFRDDHRRSTPTIRLLPSIALSLLLVAAIFQVADGVQIGARPHLRGYKDTTFPMAINIFAYWVVAFPLAYLAAITYQSPPNYIWVAFRRGPGDCGVASDLAIQSPVALSNLPGRSRGCRRRGIRLLRGCSPGPAMYCDAESGRTDR